MIVVDRSVWVSVLRSQSWPGSATLAQLIDADSVVLPLPVRIELLAGVPARHRKALHGRLGAVPVAYPTDETWALVERCVASAADKGQHFRVGDLLVAALGSERTALVWSPDSDFDRVEKQKLVQCY